MHRLNTISLSNTGCIGNTNRIIGVDAAHIHLMSSTIDVGCTAWQYKVKKKTPSTSNSLQSVTMCCYLICTKRKFISTYPSCRGCCYSRWSWSINYSRLHEIARPTPSDRFVCDHGTGSLARWLGGKTVEKVKQNPAHTINLPFPEEGM